jgi:hypothetical protein
MMGKAVGVKKIRKLLKKGLKGLEKNDNGEFMKQPAEPNQGAPDAAVNSGGQQSRATAESKIDSNPRKLDLDRVFQIVFEKPVLDSITLGEFSGDFQQQLEGVEVVKVVGGQAIEVHDQIIAIASESVAGHTLGQIQAKLDSAPLPVTVQFTDRFWRSLHSRDAAVDGDLGWEARSHLGCGSGKQMGHLLPKNRGGEEAKETAEDGEQYFYWFSTSPMGFGDRMRIFYGN